jgi:Kef-type K+ transport system membrane component KefB
MFDLFAHFPVKDPVFIFAIILFVILLAPLLIARLRIPSIVGLILAGMALGPKGGNILEREGITLFATVGLLYIMFLAGLKMDMGEFRRHRSKALFSGILTFSVAMIGGTLVTMNILHFEPLSAVLISAAFASNTLIAYPIVTRLGIVNNAAVSMAVGATMVADLLALVVLALVTRLAENTFSVQFAIQLFLIIAVLFTAILLLFPIIARFYFRRISDEGVSQYIFLLAMLFLAASLCKLASIEPIIGAFVSGLALNRTVPSSSTLMNRVDFVGNAIFIPFFLIGVGMLIDIRIFWSSQAILITAGVMLLMSVGVKWLSAFISQKIFGLNRQERQVAFGLTVSKAAATLAIVLEGYRLGIMNDVVLNATVIIILLTCMISSFVVENAGRRLAVAETNNQPELNNQPERILVPISNPKTYERLIDFALMIKSPRQTEPIFPLSIVSDDETYAERVINSNKMLKNVQSYATASGQNVQVITRVDTNIVGGISRAIKDLLITDIVIGWNTSSTATDIIFGTVSETLPKKTERMLLLPRLVQLNTITSIVVVVPPKAEFEKGFSKWVSTIQSLSKQTGSPVRFFANDRTSASLRKVMEQLKGSFSMQYNNFEDWEDFLVLAREVKKDDLLVVITARPATISYMPQLDSIPRKIERQFADFNTVLIFPEQNPGQTLDANLLTDGMDFTPIQENINRLNRWKKWFSR